MRIAGACWWSVAQRTLSGASEKVPRPFGRRLPTLSVYFFSFSVCSSLFVCFTMRK